MVIGLSTPWQLTVIQWSVHMLITRVILMMIDVVMTNHGIFAYKTLLSVVLHFNVFGLRSSGTSRSKRSKYLQTYTQVVLFAANPRKKMLLSGNLERIKSPTLESRECPVCQVCQCLSWKTYTCCKKQNLKSETKLHILYAICWTTLLPWD